jgi:hypothetical protein
MLGGVGRENHGVVSLLFCPAVYKDDGVLSDHSVVAQ